MTDTKLSPQGNFVSFVREQNLFVFDLANSCLLQAITDNLYLAQLECCDVPEGGSNDVQVMN